MRTVKQTNNQICKYIYVYVRTYVHSMCVGQVQGNMPANVLIHLLSCFTAKLVQSIVNNVTGHKQSTNKLLNIHQRTPTHRATAQMHWHTASRNAKLISERTTHIRTRCSPTHVLRRRCKRTRCRCRWQLHKTCCSAQIVHVTSITWHSVIMSHGCWNICRAISRVPGLQGRIWLKCLCCVGSSGSHVRRSEKKPTRSRTFRPVPISTSE